MSSRRRSDGFQSFSLFELLTRPFRVVGGWFASAIQSGDGMSSTEDQTVGGMILGLLTLPMRFLVAWILFMINSWAVSRAGWSFVKALPALLTVTVLLAGLWAANFLFESRSVGASHLYYNLFLSDEEHGPKIAQMFAEKLVELKPNSEFNKYQLAEVREVNGDRDGALDIMQYLAHANPLGYPHAHVWLAKYYMISAPGLTDEQRDQLALGNLNKAIEQEPNNVQANYVLGMFHQEKARDFEKGSDGRREEVLQAVNFFRKAMESSEITAMSDRSIQWGLLPTIITLLKDLGEEGEAKLKIDWAMRNLLPLARDNADYLPLWRSLIGSCISIKDYETANQIITEAIQLAKLPEVRAELEQLAVLTVLDQADNYSDLTDREQFAKRLKLLSQSIAQNPRNRPIYQRLLFFVAEKSNKDFNLNWLQESVLANPNPGIVHILLGVHKISHGDVLGGQKHWRIAEQMFPLTQFVVNNLIDVAITDYPEDFENMLDVLSLAIELFPNQPLLYQTRGTYFKKLERYPEAAADLLHASESLPKLLSIRKHLIDCYQHLGETEKANDQQFQIQSILSDLSPEQKREAEIALKQMN